MRIGLAYDLKETVALELASPEDALEEYDSTETVELIASSLESLGHSVVMLGGGREFLNNILTERVEFVFNIAEGRGNYRSREAQVPSVLSYQGGILVPGYAASKHALVGLTQALANEWAGQGINVNAVAPGYTATENTKALPLRLQVVTLQVQ